MRCLEWIKENWIWIFSLLLFIELRKFFGIRETSKNELESKEETRSFFGLIQYFFAIDQIIG